MILKSKLDTFVSQYIGSLRKKSLFLQKNFASMLALLLFGFLVGNVFGTFLNTLRVFFFWDVFIIFILIGLLEILNYNVYHVKNRLVFLGPFQGPEGPGRSFALDPTGQTFSPPKGGEPERSSGQVPEGPGRSFALDPTGQTFESRKPDESRKPYLPRLRRSTANRNVVPAKIIVQFLNFFKIGLMIGFFVDAFKVGS